MSMTTSPSTFKLRPSAVYSGRGFSVMSTGVVGFSLLAALFFGASVATVWSAKPPACTVPVFLLGGGVGSIAETCARHRTANSLSASRTVAVAISARKRWRAQAVDVGCVIRVALAGYSVGIAEAACLHFVDRSHDGCRRGAASGQIADLHVVFRTFWLLRL